MTEPPPIRKPRCYLFYALAPGQLSPADANRILNTLIADPALPVALFHDHFIGQNGGFVIFYVETPEERDALYAVPHLEGWEVEIHPLIYSQSPSGFDDQIAFTLRAYRGLNWEWLRHER